MAGLADLRGKVVYLDTNIFIYVVEGYEPEQEWVRAFLLSLQRGEFTSVTSAFTLAELLVKPFALGRDDIAATYVDLVQDSDFLRVVPVDRDILIEAARYRAVSRSLMPDAIHVASAIAAGCDVFLTNDLRLKLPPTIALVSL